MDDSLWKLEAPGFEHRGAFTLAGICERYNREANAGIPAQWQRFKPWIGNIPGQIGFTTYGAVFNGDESGNFDYLCAVEVADSAAVPRELQTVEVPESRYAVFRHREHISTIGRTWGAIFDRWLPESGLRCANRPQFELYGPEFNPRTQDGGLEIWIPINDLPGRSG
jgi:AraC family transcriptional regulator